jgi:chromosome segregation ATPase
MIGLTFVIGLPVSFARTRKPAIHKTEEVSTQPTPNLDIEIAALRQQIEKTQQDIRMLRGQVEEGRMAADALAARLDGGRAAGDALAAQLVQLRQDLQRQQHVVYGVLGTVILGVGLLGAGWLLRKQVAVRDREAIVQEMRLALRGHLLTMQNQRESDVAARQKVEEELEHMRRELTALTTRSTPSEETPD